MATHDYDKILTRLTIVLQRLYEGELLSISDLAEEFNVSVKTIQRDFNERLVRFPIHKEGRRWRMSQGYSLEKNRTLEEELILDVLAEIAQGVGGGFGSKTKTLFSKLQNEDINPVFSKIAIEDLSGKTHLFKTLQEAIAQNRQIKFTYNKKQRTLNPYRIVSFEGFWYLYGEEVKDTKLKTYYLKDVTNLQTLDTPFQPKEEPIDKLKYAINTWFEPNNALFEVRLLAQEPIAKYFTRRPLSLDQQLQQNKDGSIEITLKATSHNEVLHEIKKWMPNLIVLEPKTLQTASLEIAQEFLGANSDHPAS